MKQPRVIQRLSSLLLASLLLFAAVWGQGGLVQQHTSLARKVSEPVAKQTKSGKATDSRSDDAQLNAAGYEAVVTSAIQVGGSGQSFFLLPEPALLILMLLSVPLLRCFTFPHYFFSYFRHVFGCTIAPNAP